MTNRGRFGLILWGFVLTILDLQVGYRDLLPDSLGYMFVAIGAWGLSASERQFVTACVLSLLLVPLSLVDDFLVAGRAAGTVSSVLDCALVWFLLGGIIRLALSKGSQAFAQRVARRRLALIVISVALAMMGFLIGGERELGAPLGLVFGIIMLVLVVMLVGLLREAMVELGTADPGVTPNPATQPDVQRTGVHRPRG